ncbi:MAG: MBL fold metallo-hydrolase [Rhodospirillaceae bacterium]|nr:MBL fold metallo-hydrolase [Rhodospirillaceae bacterium]
MRVTILGCGGSDGVPTIGGADGRGDWGVCDPAEPRNRRTRAGIHIATGDLSLLIDTSPDLRGQLLANGIGQVTHVLYTHDHADHTHGLNELRRLGFIAGGRMPIYADAGTMARLQRRFGYAFEQRPGSPYPPILDGRLIQGDFELGGVAIRTVVQDHGFGETTLGFRIGDFAYSTDTVGFSDEGFAALEGLAVWIVDCFGHRRHPTHAHWDQTLAWIERLKPRRAILTHMGTGMDYETIRRACPPGVEPGYDGMIVAL